jgi:hypothetical protein
VSTETRNDVTISGSLPVPTSNPTPYRLGEMMTVLEHPPDEPEGDDSEAGGGTQVAPPPVGEDELEDADELDETDVDDDE